MLVPSVRLMDGVLAAAIATGKILDPAAVFCVPYVSKDVGGAPTTVADFTLPDATDCPPQAVTTWDSVEHLADGRSAVTSPSLEFRLPDSDNAFSANGYVLLDASTPKKVLGYEEFPEAVAMSNEFTPLVIIPRLTLDPSGRWGATVTFS